MESKHWGTQDHKYLGASLAPLLSFIFYLRNYYTIPSLSLIQTRIFLNLSVNMTLLPRAVPRATRVSSTLIRPSAVKQSTSISRRYASDIKATSIKSTKTTSKADGVPPLLSSKLFELPKPRPLAKQRYESTAGVVESGLLVLSFALVGSLYAKEKVAPMVEASDNFENEEDHDIHEFIRPFDCYVVEEVEAIDADVVEVDGA